MNRNLVNEPGVSANLRSVLQNLCDISRMKPNYTNNLYYDPTQDLEKLEKKVVSFQGLVVDGEAKRRADPGVDQWMDDLNDLICNVENIFVDVRRQWNDQVPLDDLKTFSDDLKNRFEKILARAKKLAKKAQKLELKRGSGHILWGESKVTLPARDTSSVVDTSEIHGREKDQTDIVNRLLEVNAKQKLNYDVVGIWGMEGLGKTTLAQLVFNHPKVYEHFQVRRWVCISDVFDVARAMKGLIGDDSAGDVESLQNLHQRLQKIIQNKKILFVLDDVWLSTGWNEKWNMIKVPFNSCQKGSKILLTTRDCYTAQALGDENPYPLKELLHEQCISLFKDKAFGNAEIDEGEKEKLMIWGDKIVRACKGLPLAVKLIGSILQRAKEETWRVISEKTDIWNMNDIKDGIHRAIRLRYG